MIRISLEDIGLGPRTSPRPVHLRQAGYDEQFDDSTFVYNAFCRAGRTYLICAPIPDKDWEQVLTTLTLDGKPLDRRRCQLFRNKIHKLIVSQEARQVGIGSFQADLAPNRPRHPGRHRVLYTLQKNNRLEWLRDWAVWHHEQHQIDSLIVYDNDSCEYGLAELRQALQLPGLEVVVEGAPYKYGPGAHLDSGWDSDYLQYAMFEDVRYRHCNPESLLMNADVDELVVRRDGRSVFEAAREPRSIYFYAGRWVDVEDGKAPSYGPYASHSDHGLLNLTTLCPNKWTANLKDLPDALFLRVHDCHGSASVRKTLTDTVYLHHRCINTNWKTKRQRFIKPDTATHMPISQLAALFP